MKLFARVALGILAAALAVSADSETICNNSTGTQRGHFYTFWHNSGSGCLHLTRAGSYRVKWMLGANGNLVAGTGWATGRVNRIVGYDARSFHPGSNGYLSLYGWSKNPVVEYYVVENWGTFVPPGRDAVALGTLNSDGGTYRIYRTERVGQPSVDGIRTFYQYWSVRTSRRSLNKNNFMTFANHVAAWREAGLKLGPLDYQVLATEGFGSEGSSDIELWEE